MAKKKGSKPQYDKSQQTSLNNFIKGTRSIPPEEKDSPIIGESDKNPKILKRSRKKQMDFERPWPEIVKPLPNELLSSWMTRVSLENLAGLDQLVKYYGVKPYLFDYDVEYNPSLIHYFADKSGK